MRDAADCANARMHSVRPGLGAPIHSQRFTGCLQFVMLSCKRVSLCRIELRPFSSLFATVVVHGVACYTLAQP